MGEITDRVYLCEGIGQAWAVNKATGAAAVVCFGAGRMARVTAVLRKKYPAAVLVIVPDCGKENQAAEIAAAVAGQWVEMPADKPSNYDANDYAQEFGTGALAALLERPQSPLMRFKLLSDDDLCKLPPLQWRIKKVLPETGLAAVFGASGSGKSFLVLDMLQSIAAGRDWFGYKTKSCNVLYCGLEGEGGIAGRVNAYRIRHGKTAANIRYLVEPFNLLSDDVAELAKTVNAGGGADVVVLDTLNRAAPRRVLMRMTAKTWGGLSPHPSNCKRWWAGWWCWYITRARMHPRDCGGIQVFTLRWMLPLRCAVTVTAGNG